MIFSMEGICFDVVSLDLRRNYIHHVGVLRDFGRGRFLVPEFEGRKLVCCSRISIFKKNEISWHTHSIPPPPEFVCTNHQPSAQLPEIHKIVVSGNIEASIRCI